jgi:hypothetical protein
MRQKAIPSIVLVLLAAVAAAFAGCDRVKEFNDLLTGGTEALSKESSAYLTLKAAAPNRGEAQIPALRNWIGTLKNLKAVLEKANEKLTGKNESKIRADKDVQATLARFRAGVDEVLSRNYGEAALKLVPPWRLDEARGVAMDAPGSLKSISGLYARVFAATNPHDGKTFQIDVLEDLQILDTYQGCIDKVEAVSKSQAKSGYCVSAARVACGHQIDLACVETQVKDSLKNNLCPDVKSETIRIDAGETFRPESHVGSNEELKEWKYGQYVKETNPNRTVSTFCPGDYDNASDAVLSTGYCGYGKPKVRIYGYDEKRHVLVEIEGVKHSDDSRKDVLVNVYVDNQYVGQRVITPSYGWSNDNNVYSLTITERAFQWGTKVRLKFLDLVDVNVVDQNGASTGTKKAPWVVDAEIRGEDVPFIKKREVILTKYTPNSWVGGIVRACAATAPVLK